MVIKMFYGRINEINILKRMYQEDKLVGSIIYGRKRFGKSTLIKESSKYFNGVFIYYQCLKAVDIVNARGLSLVVKEKLDNVFLPNNITFTEVLDYLLDLYLLQFY